jgi:hypothetical protein
MEQLSTEQRYLLGKHNIAAMRAQAAELAALPASQRGTHLRGLLEVARAHFTALPAMSGPGESAAFLNDWADVL